MSLFGLAEPGRETWWAESEAGVIRWPDFRHATQRKASDQKVEL